MEFAVSKPEWCGSINRRNIPLRLLRFQDPQSRPRSSYTRASFLSYDPDSDILRKDSSLEEDSSEDHSTQISRTVDISELIDYGQTQEVRETAIWDELEDLTVKRLQCICRSYGLSVTGRKRDLIERILHHEETHEEGISCWREGIPPLLQSHSSTYQTT